MNINRLPDDNGRTVLQIEADWPELAADYEDVVSTYSQVKIAGFRPGKAPRSVIEGRFQKQMLDDFSQRVAQRLGKQALRDAGAESMGPVEISDVECVKGKTFRLNVSFWPMPEIGLPDLGSLAAGDDDKSDPRDLISKRLLELVSFTVPDAFVQAELGPDQGGCARDSDEWKAAADRVRLMLVLKKIAGREGIEVSEADVEQRIKEKASEFGEDSDSLRTKLQKGGGWQRLKDMLIAEGTLTYLMEINQQHYKNKE